MCFPPTSENIMATLLYNNQNMMLNLSPFKQWGKLIYLSPVPGTFYIPVLQWYKILADSWNHPIIIVSTDHISLKFKIHLGKSSHLEHQGCTIIWTFKNNHCCLRGEFTPHLCLYKWHVQGSASGISIWGL